MALIIDFETTGLIETRVWGKYPPHEELDKYKKARAVQFTMMVCNEKFEEIELTDYIVKVDVPIPNANFHGITNEISETKGILFSKIAEHISTNLKRVSHIVAHNALFDLSILKSELYRHGLHSILEEVNEKQVFCTMMHTTPMLNIRMGNRTKSPNLEELYRFVFNEDIQNTHNSEYDVRNLHKAIKKLYDSGRLNYKKQMIYTPLIPMVAVEPMVVAVEESDADILIPIPANEPSVAVKIDYSKMTVVQLTKLCKDRKIKGYSGKKKNNLIEMLSG